MLCCVGLLAGLAVGQSLGGPWAVVAPAAGFGIGLLADMKLMKGLHGHAAHAHAPPPGAAEAGAPRLATAPESRRNAPAVQDASPA